MCVGLVDCLKRNAPIIAPSMANSAEYIPGCHSNPWLAKARVGQKAFQLAPSRHTCGCTVSIQNPNTARGRSAACNILREFAHQASAQTIAGNMACTRCQAFWKTAVSNHRPGLPLHWLPHLLYAHVYINQKFTYHIILYLYTFIYYIILNIYN